MKQIEALDRLIDEVETGDICVRGYDPYMPLHDHRFKIALVMRGSLDAYTSVIRSKWNG